MDGRPDADMIYLPASFAHSVLPSPLRWS